MPAWLQLMIDSFWPLLSAGLIFTVPLTLITFVLGILLGFLVALARLYGPPPRWLCWSVFMSGLFGVHRCWFSSFLSFMVCRARA